MSDPFTMAIGGMAAIGGGLQAKGMLDQGAAEKAASEYNALISEEKGRQQEALIRRESRRHRGRMRAAIAKSGVTTEGSPLIALAESAANAEFDALNARVSAQAEARLSRKAGRTAQKQAKLGALGSVLQTGAQVGGMMRGP